MDRKTARVGGRIDSLGCGTFDRSRHARNIPISGPPPRRLRHRTDLELAPFIAACQELTWEVHVVSTPDALDAAGRTRLADLTHHPVREDDGTEALDPLPPADAFAVAPASFDLVNKWAYGLNDNLALRLLNEATGIGLPVVVVPAPTPAWPGTRPSGRAWTACGTGA